MKINNFITTNQTHNTTTINDIRVFEGKYNVKLPGDYVEFLLRFNGGDVELDEDGGTYIEGLKDKIHMDVFFGVNTGSEGLDIETWTDDYSDELPEGIILIGCSYEQGLVALHCVDGERCLSYWDHTWEFECSNEESNSYFISNTFTEFLAASR